MKKYFKITIVLLFVVSLVLVTGCDKEREELSFKGKEGSIVFNVHKDGEYKISTDKNDFRTSREQGLIIGKNFKIGIEFDDTFDYFFKSDFSKLKEKRKDYDDYKEIKYSDIDGIQYFYGGYMRYEVVLPIKGAKEHVLVLTVYGNGDNEQAAKEAIKNEEVQDILNHIVSIEAD